MNPEIEKLIKEYLTDGIISEKERKVLLRKAENMGLNVDEVDLYIDAQQQKVDQVIDAAAQKKRGASCPFCGGSVPQLTDKCPHCGEHITIEASKEIEELINQLEDALVGLKSGKETKKSKADVERYVRKAKLYYENNPKVNKLLGEIDVELNKALSDQKKEAIIALCKKYWYIIVALLVVLILLFVFRPTRIDNAEKCIEAITDVLEDGNVEEAIKYYEAFKGGTYYIQSTIHQIIVASAEHNKLDVAYDFINRRGDFSDLKMLKNAYIDSGKFEEYEKISGITSLTYSSDKREYVEFLEAWIDYLVTNGRMLEAKKIIDNRLLKFDEYENPDGDHYPYQRDKVRKRLYDRAGIQE
jgi:hypothetical protein